MPIDPPTDEHRNRRAADLRERAALVRENGWEPYVNVWSSGEVAGVRAQLDEPGGVDAAVEVWAPTLWGTSGAEVDEQRNYDLTRRWFAAVRDGGTVSGSTILYVEPRGGTVLRITHASGLVHDTDLAYTGASAEAVQAAEVVAGAVVVQLADGRHTIAGHVLEEHAEYGCPGECGWQPGDSLVIRRVKEEQ
jgi:hypothetical protein